MNPNNWLINKMIIFFSFQPNQLKQPSFLEYRISTRMTVSSPALISPLRFHPLMLSQSISATQKKKMSLVAAAGKDHYYGGGRLVDENMIVLRKRIHEMKMVERNYEPPSHWMLWEKRFYSSYDSLICDSVGLLQSFLMNSRPTVAFATLLLLFLSVPISSTAIAFRLFDLFHWLLAHLP